MYSWIRPSASRTRKPGRRKNTTSPSSKSVAISPSTCAVDPLLTRLDESTKPALMPPAPKMAAGAEVASLPTYARMVASDVASTCTAPSAVIGLCSTTARASAGFSPLNASEINGSPRRASMASMKRFDGSQPMVLNASTRPNAFAPDSAAERVVASISATVSAWMSTSPSMSRTLEVTSATAEPRTRLVAMMPLTASEVPWPLNELPPEELAVTSASARTTACSSASTVSASAVTSAKTIVAVTSLRTSFSTTAAAMPTDGEEVKLKPSGMYVVTPICFHQLRSVYGMAVPPSASGRVGAPRLAMSVPSGPIHS